MVSTDSRRPAFASNVIFRHCFDCDLALTECVGGGGECDISLNLMNGDVMRSRLIRGHLQEANSCLDRLQSGGNLIKKQSVI